MIQYEQYKFNGDLYELSESTILPPERLDTNAATWITYAMNAGDYEVVIEKIQQFLSDESQLQAMITEFGPSLPDYLQFQLGLAYAFQSDIQQARAIFEGIQQNPQNPSTTTLSKAAQAFWENYTGDFDLYKACQASLSVMEQAFTDQPLNRYETGFDQYIMQAWGYTPGDIVYSIALCNLNEAFNKITSELEVTQFENSPERLRELGVKILSSVEADLDGDGQREWVLLTDTPGDDASVNLWVLHKTSKGILPLTVVSWERKHFDLPHEKIDTSGLRVETIVTPAGTTIAFLHVEKYLYPFKLDVANQSIGQILFSIDSVEKFVLYQRNDKLELEITTNNDYCQHCKEAYVWLNDGFTWPDLVAANHLADAEETLLNDLNPRDAISMLHEILNNPLNQSSPHLMYLLGLAYELTGDESNAIQTYWKLWHDFPQSAHARLAQAKLELKK